MASQTIPNLPVATGLNGTEEFYAVQAGQDVRVSAALIASFAQASPSFPLSVSSGGTGESSLTQYSVLLGNGTSPVQALPNGTTGQFLIANTMGSPQWANVTPGAAVSDINFGTTGLTPTSPTTGSVTVGGTVNPSAGGTGNTTLTANAILVGNGTSATTDTGAGSSGQVLVGVTSGVPKWLPAGTLGYFLTAAGPGSDPTWTNVTPGSGVTSISFGTTGLTPNTPTTGDVVAAGTLAVANGGTGLSSISAAHTALFSSDGTSFTTGTLPTNAGGTGLTSFTSGGAVYASSSSVLTTGTLPVSAGGTGSTASTGTGVVVLATNPIISAPTVSSLNGSSLAGFRNRIVNGGMAIDQRNAGASQTFTAGAALAYSVDRFYAYCTGANVTGQRVTNSGATGSPSLFCYQFTGAASVTGINFAQRIAAANSYDMAGQTVTLGVNLANSLLGTVTWTLYYANSTDSFGTIASPTVTSIATGTFTVTTSMSRFSAQIIVPSAATTGLQLVLAVGAQTSGTWKIGNVSLSPGNAATPFEIRALSVEQDMCNSRYETSYGGLNKVGTVTQAGAEYFQFDYVGGPRSNNDAGSAIRFSSKAATPTVTLYSPASGASGKIRNYNTNADASASAANIGTKSFQWSYTDPSSQTGINVQFHWTADCEL